LALLISRWLGFWAFRRAYRLLLAPDDPRPLPERLAHEGRRLLLVVGLVILLGVGLVVAAIVALFEYYG
jgi:hypothetical protein